MKNTNSTLFPSPSQILREKPLSLNQKMCVTKGRQNIVEILSRLQKRFVVVIGPCSIHDIDSTLEYADKLARLQEELQEVVLVMRVYLEKPRTALGWRGFMLEPHLQGVADPLEGIYKSRDLLQALIDRNLYLASEFLHPELSLFYADCITWGCIGARTSTSPTHRQLASSLPFPIGIKNSVEGSLQAAVNGVLVANQSHTFLGIDEEGKLSLKRSQGNPFAHVVLRGGTLTGPNYHQEAVEETQKLLAKQNLLNQMLIDCSHQNSGRSHTKQLDIFKQVYQTKHQGIFGAMVESHLFEGNQNCPPKEYGKSITDPCLSFEQIKVLLLEITETLTCV